MGREREVDLQVMEEKMRLVVGSTQPTDHFHSPKHADGAASCSSCFADNARLELDLS